MSQSKEEAEVRAMDVQRESDLQVRELRPVWARRLFITSVVWLLAVFGLLVAQGRGCVHLAESVLVAFITTTTANVLATLVVVVKFIFPDKK
jgi:hypothetical protein